ncbi:redoxin domain-containing protein [Pseudodesulfovibrio sp. F-1]|uniref:Redoxin domain-containing protein n=1 Tax=Pseudodesulfovibrio alkaliphilus TaxID=2661613 RepID=A0A7K1KKU9_9BACT|nr:redoxin domain-containing protein [Pseudodesulfovibrio alkaliphilus]MUM76571.1 redoxin domain-containing protein [Pseudodesulfovibrio alkaliphilus]
MRTPLLTTMALLMLYAPVAATALAQQPRPFPDLTLNGTRLSEQAAYLGVADAPFRLTQIKAEYLFIEAYSLYCPACQRDAPALNELHRRIETTELGARVRLIGLGLGNTSAETDHYRDKYAVPFPLFEDGEYQIHRELGEPVAPTYYIVRLEGAAATILYEREGPLEADIFDTLTRLVQGG